MSPRMGSGHDDERFDDPAHDEIRALLGDARVTEPIPAEVASRLDDVLAGLRPEPVVEHPSNVVPLRRRWAPRLLAAAAVVVVAGGAAVGVGQMVQQDRGSDNATAFEGSGDTTAQDNESSPESADQGEPSTAALDTRSALKSLPDLTAADFDATARALSRQVLELRKTDGLEETYSFGSPSAPAPSRDHLDASPQASEPQALSNLLTDQRGANAKRLAELCAGPAGSEATKVRIRFEGELAVLLFGKVTDGSQPVSAWTCDGSRLLARTTVPVS